MKIAAFVPSSEDSDEEFNNADNTHEAESKIPKKNLSETKLAHLQDQLREAIEKEDYERAAKLRDEITRLRGSSN